MKIIDKLGNIKNVFALNKEFKKIKQNPEQVKQRIAIFYDEYSRQSILIEKKIKLAKGENLLRIKEYKKDLGELNAIIDKFVFDINENPEEKMPYGLKQKLIKTRIGQFILLIKQMNSLNHKYKKEKCDIDNFEV